MKKEDVKIGMKVVPFQRMGGSLVYNKWINSDGIISSYFKKHGYLYVSDIEDEDIFLHINASHTWGDCFLAEDFKPYVENPKKNIVFNYDVSPCITEVDVYDSKNNYIETQKVVMSFENYTVIKNNRTIIVVLDNGIKGIAKCNPSDVFDEEKGFKIAYTRAIIKDYKRILKQLCR